MSDIDDLVTFMQRENAKATAERQVLASLISAMMSRHAKQYDDPEQYIMTLTAGAISGFDQTEPEDELGALGFEHGATFCNEIETRALSQLQSG